MIRVGVRSKRDSEDDTEDRASLLLYAQVTFCASLSGGRAEGSISFAWKRLHQRDGEIRALKVA